MLLTIGKVSIINILEGLPNWQNAGKGFRSQAGTLVNKNGEWVFVPSLVMSSTHMTLNTLSLLNTILSEGELLIKRLNSGAYII